MRQALSIRISKIGVAAAAFLAFTVATGQQEIKAAKSQASAGFFDDFKTIDTRRWYISNGWANGSYQSCTWNRNNLRVRNGMLQLRITAQRNPLRDYTCAEVRTHAALGYGVYEARMRAAAGSGLNSAMFTYSGRPLTPVHDEIDFEILGRNPRIVELNYFVNGRGEHGSKVPAGNDSSSGFNTYAFEWRPDRIRWFVNGHLVRTTSARAMPKTPGQFFFSLWAGSSEKADWLGKLDAGAVPTMAEIDWAAYTPLDRRCMFPQSITCTQSLNSVTK